MKIDMKKYINDDKNFKVRSECFIGTIVAQADKTKIGGYIVQIIFEGGLAVPTRQVGTFEEAVNLESEIWNYLGY